jgi:hypothetical protein
VPGPGTTTRRPSPPERDGRLAALHAPQEREYLTRVEGAVAVDHGDPVGTRGDETGVDRRAIAGSWLVYDERSTSLGDLGGAVVRPVVDDDDVDLRGDACQQLRKRGRLVPARKDQLTAVCHGDHARNAEAATGRSRLTES